ncbi:MAG: putative aminohydrolase SsnA [Candidatus Aureabacteria bacterium]|nr:putative aminohydrolase SsnA [Candidatus Auribacterota bacterium]
MSDKKMLIGNGIVITLGEKNKVIHNGAVLVRDGVITEIGATAPLRRKARGAAFINAKGGVIMPGMINAHTHLYSTFARGLSPKQPPAANFVEILERLWWPLDRALNRDDIAYSALVPLIDCIRSGTTTIIDHHESQGCQKGCLDPIEGALRQTGVRGCLCLGVSDRYGKGRAGVEENVRFVKKMNAAHARGDDLVSAMFGLHALFTVNETTLKESVAAAEELGVGIHVHVAEDRSDQLVNQKKFGKSVVRRLAKAGALGPLSLAVHCVYVNGAEMEMLAETGTPVVHNPQSNMNNAVGVAPVIEMLRKEILVGLGTDGMTANMRDEVRVANILHKLARRDPRVFFAESCQLLLQHNPMIAGMYFNRPLGVLRKGAYADIIILEYDPPTPLTEATFLGHFLFGLCGARVNTTIVNGRVLMRDGELLTVDEKKISAKARRLAQAFWKRF